jgi:hypothetical protein
MTSIESPPDKFHWSGFVRGMRLGLPVAPGIMSLSARLPPGKALPSCKASP